MRSRKRRIEIEKHKTMRNGELRDAGQDKSSRGRKLSQGERSTKKEKRVENRRQRMRM